MLYALLHGIGKILFRLAFRLRIGGRNNLPKGIGYIVAPNHRSGLDIPVIGVALPVKMYSIAKQELFSAKLTGSFLRALGGIPVNRGSADLKALRTAIELAKSNRVLLMFPEGTRSEAGPLQKLKKGVVYISTQARIPIIPVGIYGTEKAFPKGSRFPRFQPVKVFFGTPFVPWERFDANSRTYLDDAAVYLAKEIETCMKMAEKL